MSEARVARQMVGTSMSSLLQLYAPFASRLIYISDSPLRYFLFKSIVNNSRLNPIEL